MLISEQVAHTDHLVYLDEGIKMPKGIGYGKKKKPEAKNMLDSVQMRAHSQDPQFAWHTDYRAFWERVEKEKKKAGR